MKSKPTSILLIVICCLILFCSQVPPSNSDFNAFLKKFKHHEIPLAIKGCKINMSHIADTFKISASDSLYMPLEGFIPYCTFKTNGNYVAIIYLGEADCLLPVIRTYNKTGKMIDEKGIAIGGCGVGPGFTCEEYMTLRKDYTLYTSDTISVSEIDSLGNEIKGTETKYVVYKEGRLLSSGKIELSGETRKDIK
ncbi:MAG TPA: hypothetical protein VNY36_05940 [Bacteroidia bacterium]|jgi:hypothetical protein|nr:hypothetical protein [Bacteroidia bacterium]